MIAGLNRLIKKGVYPEIRCTLIKSDFNVSEIFEFISGLSENGFPRIVIELALSTNYSGNSIYFSPEDCRTLAIQERELLPEVMSQMQIDKHPQYFIYYQEFAKINSGNLTLNPSTLVCGAAMTLFAVGADRMIYPVPDLAA